jgi:hypothetical protein
MQGVGGRRPGVQDRRGREGWKGSAEQSLQTLEGPEDVVNLVGLQVENERTGVSSWSADRCRGDD